MSSHLTILRPVQLSNPGVRAAPDSWYPPATVFTSTATQVLTANRVYYLPFSLPGAAIDTIAVNVGTGAGNARIGLYYNVYGTGLPGGLIVDAGQIDVSGTGLVSVVLPSVLTMPMDWFWAAAVFDSTPTMVCGVATNAAILGSSSTTSSTRALMATLTFGALPATATLTTPSLTTTAPALFLKKS